MPTYVYACTECGDQFEKVQAFSDPSLTVCPNCSGKLRKVFNSVGIVFKGSGFYRNDSREKVGSGSGTSEKSGEAATKTADKPTEKAGAGASSSGSGSGSSGSGSSGSGSSGSGSSGSGSSGSGSSGSGSSGSGSSGSGSSGSGSSGSGSPGSAA